MIQSFMCMNCGRFNDTEKNRFKCKFCKEYHRVDSTKKINEPIENCISNYKPYEGNKMNMKQLFKGSEMKISKRVKQRKEEKVSLAIELAVYLLGNELSDKLVESQATCFMQMKQAALESSIKRAKHASKTMEWNITPEEVSNMAKEMKEEKARIRKIKGYTLQFGERMIDLS